MQIGVGYELIYDCPQLTPMTLTLHIHSTRVSDIVVPDHLICGRLDPAGTSISPSASRSLRWAPGEEAIRGRLQGRRRATKAASTGVAATRAGGCRRGGNSYTRGNKDRAT